MNARADPWALAAATRPLAFSQVREDPRLDLEVVRRLPAGSRAMMIASGGETAVCLARRAFREIVLVDVNPAQLALTRCRLHLAENFSPETNLALLGHAPMGAGERGKKWEAIFEELELPAQVFGGKELVADLGPDHCGRYEAAFAELRHLLAPHAAAILDFLRATDVATASRMIAPETETGRAIDSAFARALRLENLVALFGEGATRNPRRPFHIHFAAQLRDFVTRRAPAANPWIWQLLAGKFPAGKPADWFRDSAPILCRPTFCHAPMSAALAEAPAGSVDFIHLSNILDWLAPDEARRTLAAAWQALRGGGFLLIRQLNSSLDIPSLFPALAWDRREGWRLQRLDRSFFYPEILLASRL